MLESPNSPRKATFEIDNATIYRERRPLIESSGREKVRPHFSRAARQFQLRWSLFSRRKRLALSIIGFTIILALLVFMIDVCLGHYRPGIRRDSGNRFAVVINTYKRPEMLQAAVAHYSQTCGPKYNVAKVYIVWAQLDETPPSFSSVHTRSPTSPVEVIRVSKDSLNSRFLPIKGLDQDAVFMVDDDIRVDCQGLFQGFAAWTEFPQSMVGYYPRLALSGKDGYVYHSWPMVYLKSRFNMILTKACFLHRRYFGLYFDEKVHPPEILEYVDRYKNCEDVAMSLLVANNTNANGRLAMPVYVETSVADKGLFGGISTGSGHMDRRSSCLTDLSRIYEEHSWHIPFKNSEGSFDLLEASWYKHVPAFSWLSRPSNPFEWFALGNFFK